MKKRALLLRRDRHVRPTVGVTGSDRGSWVQWSATRFAIWRAGGKAVRISPKRWPAGERTIEGLDALIIGGGADVDPALYNEEKVIPQLRKEKNRSRYRSFFEFFLFVLLWLVRKLFSTPAHQSGDRDRDHLENELLAQATQAGLPILGICRGMQLINVHFGGSLYQDIATFYEESPQLHTVLPKKTIEIEYGTKLFRLCGCRETRVNSLHRQSVKILGKGLKIAAHEPNGIIQAIEHIEYPYLMGVQWHPEFLPQDQEQREIFQDLVRVAIIRHLARLSPTQSHSLECVRQGYFSPEGKFQNSRN